MCLWILTACLGLIPANPPQNSIVIVTGVPAPIILPTTAAPPPTTMPTAAPTAAPTTQSTAAPTQPPTTMAPTMPPTMTSPTPGNTPGTPPVTTTGTPPPITTTSPPSTAPPSTTAAPPSTSSVPPSTSAVPPSTTVAPSSTTSTPLSTNITPSLSTNTNLPAMTVGEGLLLVIICDKPGAVCISNPYQTTTGAPMIDPRLGTTPGSSAALQAPVISGYSAQIPASETAVKFPREKRSLKTYKYRNNRQYLEESDNKHVIRKRQTTCMCVPAGTCPGTTNFGAGLIDTRIVTVGCAAGQVYCCTAAPAPAPTPIACGVAQPTPATVVTPAAGQANFGEYPWQALVLTKQNDYIAGGVLIDARNVLTVTHRFVSYVVSGTAPNVKVRLGEWDAAGTYEPIPFQEYNVQKVFTHPSYVATTLQYDITVLRLATAVPFSPATGATTTINRACLPPTPTTSYTGRRCWVSGWGKDMFGVSGLYQNILKEVDVPIVDPTTCQAQMRTARLGPNFVLDTTSFICAGGEASKDACTGDGGSGLVCDVNGQYVLVGLVAWGLGCANANVPAAYVNIAALLPWINQQIATP